MKKKIKIYNVTLDVFRMEHIYDIEATSKKEAFEIAKERSEYNDGGSDFKLFEIEEVKDEPLKTNT